MIRHHRLIEAFLAEALGMPWDRVHDEAEVLEHYISEDLERLIAAKLGDPSPTPTATRSRPRPATRRGPGRSPLAELEPGQTATFARVSDSRPGDAPLPRRARASARAPSCGSPGAQPFGGPLLVEVDGREHALGGELARQDAGRAGGSK